MKNTTSFANILNAVNKMKEGGFQKDASDDLIWKCERDKAGNGFAVIRFLPAVSDDKTPFVKAYNHGFKSPLGKWFIEECPTTIGEQCPVCEANGVLWNSGVDSDKEIVRERKRKLSYYANVLIVSDPKNPDNEGKVKIFKFGAKIFDKIVDKLQPTVMEGEDPIDPVNVFDPFEGANFKLKIRQVEGFANFDKSEFDVISEIGSEKEVKKILEQLNDLDQFTAKEKYKSYDALQTKLNQVLGVSASKQSRPSDGDDEEFEDNRHLKAAADKAKADKARSEAKAAAPKKDDDEDDSDLAYFQRLANGD